MFEREADDLFLNVLLLIQRCDGSRNSTCIREDQDLSWISRLWHNRTLFRVSSRCQLTVHELPPLNLRQLLVISGASWFHNRPERWRVVLRWHRHDKTRERITNTDTEACCCVYVSFYHYAAALVTSRCEVINMFWGSEWEKFDGNCKTGEGKNVFMLTWGWGFL